MMMVVIFNTCTEDFVRLRNLAGNEFKESLVRSHFQTFLPTVEDPTHHHVSSRVLLRVLILTLSECVALAAVLPRRAANRF